MEAREHSVRIALAAALFAIVVLAVSLPLPAVAGTYGNGPYDSGLYGTGFVAPVLAPISSNNGGGGTQIFGSSPTAPGYVVRSTTTLPSIASIASLTVPITSTSTVTIAPKHQRAARAGL